MTTRHLVCALALLLSVAGYAAAHSPLEATSPAAGAVVARAPAQVVATYGGPLASVTSAEVRGGGARVAGAPRIDPRDARRVLIPIEGGGPGPYRVSWVVLGADGHSLAGETSFRVRVPPVVVALRRVAKSVRAAAAALDAAVDAVGAA